ncbi:hypothetical protein KQI61_10965 [Anaerocolumna aminovalerica]|uniref:hypothetical protein n=1 Tax=Anaerocolumna aminovalerica TaxID=1527 RepID=UPI001C0EB6BC|nr:hypothetical protein [Anaerocolumna aminovalerica]MBU5332724.1 hypothetical protein [Anaerocolumna aminovalerica]
MFDRELFYSLCEKYHVELSEQHDSAMMKDGEAIKSLTENEAKKAFSVFLEYFPFENSITRTNNMSLQVFDFEEYPVAC